MAYCLFRQHGYHFGVSAMRWRDTEFCSLPWHTHFSAISLTTLVTVIHSPYLMQGTLILCRDSILFYHIAACSSGSCSSSRMVGLSLSFAHLQYHTQSCILSVRRFAARSVSNILAFGENGRVILINHFQPKYEAYFAPSPKWNGITRSPNLKRIIDRLGSSTSRIPGFSKFWQIHRSVLRSVVRSQNLRTRLGVLAWCEIEAITVEMEIAHLLPRECKLWEVNKANGKI